MRVQRLQTGATRRFVVDRRAQQPVAGSVHVPELLRQHGVVAPDAVLWDAGLGRDALARPDDRIPYRAWGELLRRSADASRCSQFGVLLGRMWHLDDLGPIAEVIRTSATLGEALETLVACDAVSGGGGVGFVTKRDPIVDVGYAIYYDGITGADQIADCVLAALHNIIRELTGAAFAPTEVFLPHAKPDDCSRYRNLFSVVPHFDSEICALRFPAYWLDRSLDEADAPYRRVALIRLGGFARRDLLRRAQGHLRLLLMNGSSSGDDLADMLGMHRRTLNRRLREENTTFQELLDRVRFEVARQFLSYSNVSLDDIAAALAYSDVGPFMRSFRRWSGMTPGQWRRRALRPPIAPTARPLVAVSLPPSDASPRVTPRRWNGQGDEQESARARRVPAMQDRLARLAVAGLAHS